MGGKIVMVLAAAAVVWAEPASAGDGWTFRTDAGEVLEVGASGYTLSAAGLVGGVREATATAHFKAPAAGTWSFRTRIAGKDAAACVSVVEAINPPNRSMPALRDEDGSRFSQAALPKGYRLGLTQKIRCSVNNPDAIVTLHLRLNGGPEFAAVAVKD